MRCTRVPCPSRTASAANSLCNVKVAWLRRTKQPVPARALVGIFGYVENVRDAVGKTGVARHDISK
jgi:hypothetical protein